MPSVYLYLSTAKLDQLLAQKSNFFAGVTAKIDFKLPFISGGLSGANTTNSIANLERVERNLRREYSIPSHDQIPPGSAPVFVSFKGPAVRTIQGSEFWLAVDHNHTPLLLAGSASFALGEKTVNRGIAFSPSVDPVGAFVRAFEESNEESKDASVAASVSFIWKTLVADALRSHTNLPSVEGLAIYATSARASGDFAYVRRPDVDQIVVGTPLFVRQFEEHPASKPRGEESLVESRKRFLVQVSSIHNMERADRNQSKIDSLVYRLHCLGYRVLDGQAYGSGFYLSEYRRTGRWNRAFVLYRPKTRELAEQVRSFIDEHDDFPAELLSLEEVVEANGTCNEDLIKDDADVAITVCSD